MLETVPEQGAVGQPSQGIVLSHVAETLLAEQDMDIECLHTVKNFEVTT